MEPTAQPQGRRADLHSHTDFSDGELNPAQLVRAACQANLQALAITDHDTVAGVAETLAAASEMPIEVVPGVEFSASLGDREVHLLGLFIDPREPTLSNLADAQKQRRRQRAEQIVQRLQQLGLQLDASALWKEVDHAAVGRPHIARALVRQRMTASPDEAFRRYLGIGRPAFVSKEPVGAGVVIDSVHQAGGVAVLAHPASSRIAERHIVELADRGIDGIEVRHPNHQPSQIDQLAKLAEQLGLLPSGGSDFHGPGRRSDISLGDLTIPWSWYQALRDRASLKKGGSKAADRIGRDGMPTKRGDNLE